MNRTVHAVLHLVLAVGGGWLVGHYGNPRISDALAVTIGFLFGLVVSRTVVESFDVARRSSPGGRFVIAGIWGGISGAAFAVIAGWGGNQIFPTMPIPEWLLFLGAVAIADGLGAMMTPKSIWQSYY